jgi:hypothetical protein
MRWALIGASAIAGEYMIRAQEDGEILRVVSSSADRGAVYASEHGIPASGTDLNKALADAHVDAVYISTTNEKHLAQALATIKAGQPGRARARRPPIRTLDRTCFHSRWPRQSAAGALYASPRRRALQPGIESKISNADPCRKTCKSGYYNHHAKADCPGKRALARSQKLDRKNRLSKTDTLD